MPTLWQSERDRSRPIDRIWLRTQGAIAEFLLPETLSASCFKMASLSRHARRLFLKGRFGTLLPPITEFPRGYNVPGCLFTLTTGREFQTRAHSHHVHASSNTVNATVTATKPQTAIRSIRCRSTTTVTKATSSNNLATSAQANTDKNKSIHGSSYVNSFDPALVEDLCKHMDGDMPLSEMPDPFAKDYPRCFLCRHDIQLDHKNTRLLSQFVSPYTGRIYGRAITGLCIPMQKRVSQLIKRARQSGFMPFILKDPKYLHDPQPYDSMAKKSKY